MFAQTTIRCCLPVITIWKTPAGNTTLGASYDPLGNLLTAPADVAGYQGQTRHYDINNQWDGYNGQALPDLFAHDSNGNPTTYKGDTLTYDVGNQLTKYARNTNTLLIAGYRSDGLRAWKAHSETGPKTFFYYVGGRLLAEVNAAGMVTSYNTYGPTGLLSRTNLQTNQEIYYLFDPQGNVAQRLDGAGNLLTADRYDPWGNLQSGGDPTDPYGYHAQQGYYTDHETGLILCTHRYYDPIGGRWITRDPIGYAGGMNLYAYCAGDPFNLQDPSGHNPLIVTAAVGAVIGGTVGGINAWIHDENIWKGAGRGALIGGLAGLGAGIAAVPAVAAVGAGAAFFVPTVAAAGAMTGDLAGQGISHALGWQHGLNPGETLLAGGTALGIGAVGEAFAGAGGGSINVEGGKTNPVLGLRRVGSALKNDFEKPIYKNEPGKPPQIVKEFPATSKAHGFPDLVDNYATDAQAFQLEHSAMLYQLEGSYNGVIGRFEWIVQDGNVTHRMFVAGGQINGVPIH